MPLSGIRTRLDESRYYDPVGSVDEALDRTRNWAESDETTLDGVPPVFRGIGGPAKSGLSAFQQVVRRGASAGTFGQSPYQEAQELQDGILGTADTIREWEPPSIELPSPNDDPSPDSGSVPVGAIAAVGVIGILLARRKEWLSG